MTVPGKQGYTVNINRDRLYVDMDTEPRVIKKTLYGDAYFTIHWSKLKKAEKYDINSSVPAVAGIFELYYMDDHRRMKLMLFSRVWYGGLRSQLRKITDPELETDGQRKAVLQRYPCYYRYSTIESRDDMTDILFFFSETYFPKSGKTEHSGRYGSIYVDEISPDKMVSI